MQEQRLLAPRVQQFEEASFVGQADRHLVK
jgi:hypothetical protein